MSNSIANRYDEFQKPAVQNIVNDFGKKPTGKYLLVIPTGGGKTRTAVKSVMALYERGVLNPVSDKVLWVAHRRYLLNQAKVDGFDEVESTVDYRGKIIFEMVGNPAKTLMEAEPNLRLIVIDEAHHSTEGNVTYRPILQNASVGILGLTATPSRTDGASLGFERESFSIGFPDLEKKGIILKPEVRRVETNGDYGDITGFSDSEMAKLDTKRRNQEIIEAIKKDKDDYQKIVIYVGAVKHAENLCAAIRESTLADHYESIQYVTGKSNSRGLNDRDEFLAKEKEIKRSIIVNVDVLTEGYDDPSVNTVIMARPTNSKLVYMQAMGRAIRRDKSNELKKAFVVEIVDKLPNIRYRIENRWLYADVSDTLEPNVEDFEYSDAASFKNVISQIYDQYDVLPQHQHFPEFEESERYSVLLFRVFQSKDVFFHIPVVTDGNNRLEVQRVFNYLSERMFDYVKQGASGAVIMNSLDLKGLPTLQEQSFRTTAYQAMENSAKVVYDNETKFPPPPKLSEDQHWITFVSLRQNKTDLPADLLEFVESMVNKDEILERLRGGLYEGNDILFRFPLPLRDYIGRFLQLAEANKLDEVVDELRELKESNSTLDHRECVRNIVYEKVLPVEASLQASLSLIVREEKPCSYKLGNS